MAGPKEKRIAPRITTVVPVNCRVIASGASLLPSQRAAGGIAGSFPAKTINVSRDGMLINLEYDLVPGSQLEVSFNAPSDDRPAKIIALVAWSRRNAINLFGRYAAGLKMSRFSEKDRAALANFFKPL